MSFPPGYIVFFQLEKKLGGTCYWKKNYKITYLLFHHFTFNNKGIIFLKKRDIIVIYYLSVYFFILSTKCIVKKKKKKSLYPLTFLSLQHFLLFQPNATQGGGGGTFISLTGSIILCSRLLKPFFLVNIVWWWGPIVESKF